MIWLMRFAGAGVLLFWVMSAVAATKADYCYDNPSIGDAVKPNILMGLDSSGSMSWTAHRGPKKYGGYWSKPDSDDGDGEWQDETESEIINQTGYDKNQKYYGYADEDWWYAQDSNGTWVPQQECSSACDESSSPPVYPPKHSTNSTWFTGNFVNYMVMARIDVAREALMGGKGTSRSGNGTLNTFITEDSVKIDRASSQPSVPTGVMQDVEEDARWGVMVFGKDADGGNVATSIDESANSQHLTDTYNAIQNWSASGNTPLAEMVWSGLGYYAMESNGSNMPDSPGTPGTRYHNVDFNVKESVDPYKYELPDGTAQYPPCSDSFILLVSDGAPNADDSYPSYFDSFGSSPFDDSGEPLDNVGLYGNLKDLRQKGKSWVPNAPIDGKQNVFLYTLYAFGSSSTAADLMKRAAINGGFEDKDGDDLPHRDTNDGDSDGNLDCTLGTPNSGEDCTEWDGDLNGVPDNYFEAQQGSKFESELRKAITAILERASSGSTVATINTQTRSGGTLLQAFYLPVDTESGPAGTIQVAWKGFLRTLWTDPKGNIRTDTDPDDDLVLDQDDIVQFFFDTGDRRVKARLFPDDGTGAGTAKDNVPDTCDTSSSDVTTKSSTAANAIWQAGEKLANRDPGTNTDGIDANTGSSTPNRDIYFNYNGKDSSLSAWDSSRQMTQFNATAAVASALAPYWDLGASDTPSSGQELIEYVRGYDNPGNGASSDEYRLRQAQDASNQRYQDVWKLGAVITSTPRVLRDQAVSDPADLQGTHSAYINSSRVEGRPSMVFAGGNDGMLHAIYAGEVSSGGSSVQATMNGSNRGEEAWAFIPENALPYLRWYGGMNTDCFIPTVDYRTQLVDAAIGGASSDTQDPQGDDWRTLLIGTMGFGGKEIACGDIDGDSNNEDRSSSVFVLDVTDPENPELLWEESLPDGSLALTYPAVVRQAASGDNDQNGHWWLVLGSGPTDPEGSSFVSTPKLFVFDLENGGSPTAIDLTDSTNFDDGNNLSSTPDVAVGEPLPIDGDQDDRTDTVYFGTYGAAGSGNGGLYRLTLDDPSTPSSWGVSQAATFSSGGRPIFAAPGISRDPLNNVWFYAGTGRFLGPDDKTNSTDPQYVFGYIDDCWGEGLGDSANCSSGITVDSDLVRTDEISVEAGSVDERQCFCAGTFYDTATLSGGTYSCPTGSELVFTSTSAETYSGGPCGNSISCSGSGEEAFDNVKSGIRSNGGWYRELSSTERVFSQPSVQSGLVNVLGFLPTTDLCGYGGNTNFHAVHYQTGTPPPEPTFLNNAGVEDSDSDGDLEIQATINLGKGVPPIGESFASMATSEEGTVRTMSQTSTGQITNTTQQGQQMRSGILFTREP